MLKLKEMTKLSKFQKAILECLYTTRGYWCHVCKISWFVAEKFNQGHNDKIWDAKQAKIELKKRLHSEDWLMAFRIIDSHQKSQLLTEKYRASFSRSLKRLERRGLLERFVAAKIEKRDDKLFWIFYTGYGKTCYVRLTDKGKEVSGRMLTVTA